MLGAIVLAADEITGSGATSGRGGLDLAVVREIV